MQKLQKLPDREFNTNTESRMGFLMIKMGKMSVIDTARVMGDIKKNGMRFGEAAKKMGLISDDDIQDVLSKQFSYSKPLDKDEFSSELTEAYYTNSVQAEFMRSVRTQLGIDWLKNHQALALSGVEKGCGASRFAANLAVTFSQFGKKTLLIDANLRSPVQHEIFKLDSSPGLSDLLMGRAGLEAISKIMPLNNLSVLAAGTVPPNPHELVSGHIFKEVVLFFGQMFDVILIDTPAFSVGSDAQAIGVAVGGAMLLTRKHQTKAHNVMKASKLLKNSGVQLVGSVVIDF